MIFNYSEDKGFSSIFSKKKTQKTITPEEVSEWQALKELMEETGQSADEVAEQLGGNISESVLEYARSTDVAEQSQDGLTASVNKSGNVFDTLKSKAKGAIAGIASGLASAGVGMLIGFAVNGVVSLLDGIFNRAEKIAEAAAEARDEINKLNESLNSNREYVDDTKERFAKLAQGVDSFTGENKSLSDEDYKEFLEISSKLAELFPELDRRYDSNGNAIVRLSGDVDTIVGSLDSLIERQQELTNMEVAEKLPDLFADAKQNSEDAVKERARYKQQMEDARAERDMLLQEAYNQANIPLTLDGQSIQRIIPDWDTSALTKLENELRKRGIKYTLDQIKDENTGIPSTRYNFTISEEDEQKIISDAKKQFEKITSEYNDKVAPLYEKWANENEKVGSSFDELKSPILSWLSVNPDYKLMDRNLQLTMQSIIDNFKWEDLEFSNWEQAAQYIKNNYLRVFSQENINTSSITELFSESIKDLPASEYIEKVQSAVKEIQDQLDAQGIDIKFNLDFMLPENATELLSRVKSKLNIDPRADTAINDYVNNLPLEDLSILLKLDIDKETSLEGLIAAIDEFKNKLKDQLTFEADMSKIHEELDKIQNAYKTVASAIEEYDESRALSLDTIQSLLGLEDQYIATLFNENSQLTLNVETYNELTKAQLLSMQAKIVESALDTISSLQDEQQAKEYLKNSTLALAGAKWEEVYASIEQARSSLIVRASQGEDVYSQMIALEQLEKSTKNKQKLAEEAMKAMKNATNMFYTGVTKPTQTESKDNIFNWAANSIENLNREIDKLNTKLENASLEEKLGIYDDIDKKNKDIVNAKKKATVTYQNEWTKKASKISDTYEYRIVSRDTFKIEEFDDEKTYNAVIAAQQAYEQWQNSLSEYQAALDKRDQDKLAKIEVQKEIAQIELDTLTSEDMSNKTASQKNKQLEKEKDAKYKILQCDLKLAKSEAEQTRLRKEYKEYEKEIAEQKYENLRNERNNKIANYQSKVQHTQHDIDLKESVGKHGSKKQYTNMNTQLENQISLEKTNYEKAKTERDKYKVGTDDWNKYNDQMVEAENNIIACVQAQLENNRAIKEMDIRPYEEENEDLEELLDFLGKYQEQLNNAISHANYLIEEEIDKLNEEKEAVTEKYDTQIAAIEKEKELLTEENEERERAIALENAEYNLAKAKRNKTVRVYRKGVGFEYQADSEEIRNAQDELDQLAYENEIANYDKRIEHLNKRKEEEIKALDESIEKWEDYAEALDDAAQSYDRMVAKEDFEELFGADGIRKILHMDETMINKICSKVIQVGTDLQDTSDKIEQNNRTIKAMRENIDNTLINSLSKAVKSLLKKIGIDVSKFHSGGIVGKAVKNDLPEHLMALTDFNLKPNETFAKLLNGEVVLNTAQMSNMFDNLGRAYSALTPLYKRESSPITITIGDVNVYNPTNTDMIVNEIVKELPQKVLQKLYSK